MGTLFHYDIPPELHDQSWFDPEIIKDSALLFRAPGLYYAKQADQRLGWRPGARPNFGESTN